MRTPTPWKPNTSGAPDPFFNARREYLEKLNELFLSVPYQNLGIFTPTPYVAPFDPDTFHPTAGYAVPKSERGQIKDVTR